MGLGDTATLKEPLFTTSSWVVPESFPPPARLASSVTVTMLWPFARPVPVKSVRRSSLEKEILISWIPSPLLSTPIAVFPDAEICLPAYFMTKDAMTPSGSEDAVPSKFTGTPARLEYGPPAFAVGQRFPLRTVIEKDLVSVPQRLPSLTAIEAP